MAFVLVGQWHGFIYYRNYYTCLLNTMKSRFLTIVFFRCKNVNVLYVFCGVGVYYILRKPFLRGVNTIISTGKIFFLKYQAKSPFFWYNTSSRVTNYSIVDLISIRKELWLNFIKLLSVFSFFIKMHLKILKVFIYNKDLFPHL